MYSFRKRHNSLLAAFLPAVHVYDSLFSLRSEDVCAAHSDTILSSCALLEDMSLRRQRLRFVYKDTLIFSDSSIRLCGARYGGHKLLGKHGCYRDCG